MAGLQIFCPAKINAFLAVTGRREDGFHDLVSLVLPLDWGDDLELEPLPGRNGFFEIECDDPEVPVGPENLVWKAASVFVRKTGYGNGCRFRLTKRIPMGAGLGGGSSDATGALMGLNRLAGHPLGWEELDELAAGLGSDCPLFLRGGPVIVRGRGERVDSVPAGFVRTLPDWRVLLFKPAFSIGTAWAYGELGKGGPKACLDTTAAEARLQTVLADPGRMADLGCNSFETVIGAKFPAIPLLLRRLRDGGAWFARMSGSGSACFCVARSRSDLDRVKETVQECWGAHVFLKEVGIRISGSADERPGSAAGPVA